MNKVLYRHPVYILYLFFSLQLTKSCDTNNTTSNFQVDIQWHYINYTWLSKEHYHAAIISQEYVPENVSMAGIKIWKENLYIAMPKIRHGVPATLGSISLKNSDSSKIDLLISPFPNWNWQADTSSDCTKLQSVQSMEIDRKGVMWVLDGFRKNSYNKCPPKLLLFDLENRNEHLHTFTFSESVCLSQGGYLNDLVIDSDDEDGDFAYITDNSAVDPGLVVYSRKKDTAWKFRDSSMFAERNAGFVLVDGNNFTSLSPIDGIALSPKSFKKDKSVYYCSEVGNYLFSIKTSILKNYNILKSGDWRREVKLIGRKQADSDGMAMDNEGNLYYGLLPLYSVGKWNINEDFQSTARIIAKDEKNIKWADSFTFDNKGNLFLLMNSINKYFDQNYRVKISNETKFKVLKLYTGTKSYMF